MIEDKTNQVSWLRWTSATNPDELVKKSNSFALLLVRPARKRLIANQW
ncbi:MAG: hypothetical protein WBM32_23495 [Crocosphaera sp.]